MWTVNLVFFDITSPFLNLTEGGRILAIGKAVIVEVIITYKTVSLMIQDHLLNDIVLEGCCANPLTKIPQTMKLQVAWLYANTVEPLDKTA